jgi:hypothetical protein
VFTPRDPGSVVQTQRFRSERVYHLPSILPALPSVSVIPERQIWLVAIAIIAVDLAFFMVPIVPFLAAYVLLARPPWFKDFIDDVYDQS